MRLIWATIVLSLAIVFWHAHISTGDSPWYIRDLDALLCLGLTYLGLRLAVGPRKE